MSTARAVALSMRNLGRCLRDAGMLSYVWLHGSSVCACDGSWDEDAHRATGTFVFRGAWYPGCGWSSWTEQSP